ncbi:MAG: alpha-L-fucosidase, partial [Lentisphaeria bacterium]|nr:alpha-L-fucosidase [Lentisphaeria bacterium]
MTKEYPHGDRSWWQAARFGMFIHWGVYSVPARGEWMQTIEKIPTEEYKTRYVDNFDPDRFEPAKWAKYAKDAGMKYMVFTAKHHDGFCMWDSSYTEYKAKRDYVKEIVEAFRAEGI